MTITTTQADLDTRRAAMQSAMAAYHQVLQQYKEELGPLPRHIELDDNPHDDDKASIGLGNLIDAAIAGEQDMLDGISNDMYVSPLGTKYVLDAGSEGYEVHGLMKAVIQQPSSAWVIDPLLGHIQSALITQNTTISIPSATSNDQRRYQLMLSMDDVARTLTFTNADINWVRNESADMGAITTETFATEAEALTRIDNINAGDDDVMTTWYQADNLVEVSPTEWTIDVTERVRVQIQPWHIYGFSFLKTPSSLIAHVFDCGRPVMTSDTYPDSYGFHDQGDLHAPVAGTRHYGYMGATVPTLDEATFRSRLLGALITAGAPLSASNVISSDPVTWERVIYDGAVHYVPSRPLYNEISYDALESVGIIGTGLVVSINMGNGRRQSFRVKMLGGTNPSEGLINAANTASSDWNKIVGIFAGGSVPLGITGDPAGFGMGGATGYLEWTKTRQTFDASLAAARGGATPSEWTKGQWLPTDTDTDVVGFRPILVPVYQHIYD